MGDIPYYPDTGCNLSPSCLACHLPACKYDDPRVVPNKQARGERDALVAEALQDGLTARQVADMFGLGVRTVHRIHKARSIQ